MGKKITTIRWSAISAFEYNPEQWYETYILGKQQVSPQLTFGSMIDKKIQEDPMFIPSLPRYPVMQHGMKVQFGDLLLTGTADGIDLDKKLLFDYKTGVQPWDRKRTNDTGQLTMYLWMLYLLSDKKLKPEEWKLGIHWLPTKKKEDGNFNTEITFRDDPVVPITFQTKRNLRDLYMFGLRIKKVVAEMEEFIHSKELQT